VTFTGEAAPDGGARSTPVPAPIPGSHEIEGAHQLLASR
jgi:hypothetical protein